MLRRNVCKYVIGWRSRGPADRKEESKDRSKRLLSYDEPVDREIIKALIEPNNRRICLNFHFSFLKPRGMGR